MGVALVAILGFALLGQNNETEISPDAFLNKTLAASELAIVMDIRNADSQQRIAIMQCATNLAGNKLFVGKKLDIYGYGDGGCFVVSGNSSLNTTYPISTCDAMRSGQLSIIVKNTPQTRIYKDRMEIGSSCSLKIS